MKYTLPLWVPTSDSRTVYTTSRWVPISGLYSIQYTPPLWLPTSDNRTVYTTSLWLPTSDSRTVYSTPLWVPTSDSRTVYSTSRWVPTSGLYSVQYILRRLGWSKHWTLEMQFTRHCQLYCRSDNKEMKIFLNYKRSKNVLNVICLNPKLARTRLNYF